MKPIDISKFSKDITKAVPGINTGFQDPVTWVSTGCYMLNYLISGNFNKGIPFGKITMLAGESGSGKSYIASGNLARNAQAQGAFVILLDSENALDEEWLKAVGVDTDPDKLLRIGVAMIDEVAKIINEFVAGYKAEHGDKPVKEQPPVLFVVDSLGMLLTPTDKDQFQKGDLKGDLGRKAKALTALIRTTTNLIAPYNVGVVCTNHVYDSQDMFDPDPKISGGKMVVFASSIIVAMNKMKLKEDAEGNKVSQVMGIRSKCRVIKTRYAKPFEDVTVYIPYETGMDPYSGVFEFMEAQQLLKRSGAYYTAVDMETGEEFKLRRKQWKEPANMEHLLQLFLKVQELEDKASLADAEENFGADEEEQA
tara:strand:- start:175781 stop:176878 length:1098 start_codon:yes stop_codon:yes gene_type:complete